MKKGEGKETKTNGEKGDKLEKKNEREKEIKMIVMKNYEMKRRMNEKEIKKKGKIGVKNIRK